MSEYGMYGDRQDEFAALSASGQDEVRAYCHTMANMMNAARDMPGRGMTVEQATDALHSGRTVYTGVTLTDVGTDFDGVDYAAYLLADPDDNESIRYTEDLINLHARQQVSVKRLENPCMCEHTNHFDDEYGPRVDGAHVYLDVTAGKREARYVGPVCNVCAQTCMVDYLI